jgi:DNA-binding NarL/FixJ family response regulator
MENNSHSRHKILLLDDDADWLTLCRDLFSALPSQPDILTTTTAKRALALLETESIRLLVCDLKMPRMDGLQVLSIVRRQFPDVRTVVLSGMDDEDFRSRAYALGVDLFWPKIEMQRDTKQFNECIESLLGRDGETGFRGIQSKSLMDIIQMECLSRTSSVLRIQHGALTAKIWLHDGDLVDAELNGARGEAALSRVLAWQTGSFENLPAEPARERTIHKSVNALLLESAQSFDETSQLRLAESLDAEESTQHRRNMWKLSQLTRASAEFVIAIPAGGRGEPDALGTQNVEDYSHWATRTEKIARQLGERLGAGPLSHIAGAGLERKIVLLPSGGKIFLTGWPADADDALMEKTRKISAAWDS